MYIHNFSAGPCILPKSVLEKAAKGVIEYDQTGLSLIEMSHRSKPFVALMDKAFALVKELLNVPDTHEVLFLQGGASTQFLMSAMNFLPQGGKAAYINTGTWSSKAIKEAKLLGNVVEVASSKDKNFNYIPKNYDIPEDVAYLHYTSNNTIFGTQFHPLVEANVPLIADMSSDIMSRTVNIADYDLIYAGAQKNMGPAGATAVIVRKDALGKTGRQIPSMLDYAIHIDKESMYNTPPCFSIYVLMLTMEWLKELGGIPAIAQLNQEKADLIYQEIDRNPLFEGTAQKEDRSIMNATFVLKDDSLSDAFMKLATENGISGIKGHRSVGGFRASMYNALPLSSVKALTEVMQTFEKSFG